MDFTRCIRLSRYYYGVAERPTPVLCQELGEADALLRQLVTLPLTDYQRDALVCLLSDSMWGYAYMRQPFQKSYLLTVLNKGMMQIAAAEMYNFCMADNRVDMRAIGKRRCEQHLFVTGQLLFS